MQYCNNVYRLWMGTNLSKRSVVVVLLSNPKGRKPLNSFPKKNSFGMCWKRDDRIYLEMLHVMKIIIFKVIAHFSFSFADAFFKT